MPPEILGFCSSVHEYQESGDSNLRKNRRTLVHKKARPFPQQSWNNVGHSVCTKNQLVLLQEEHTVFGKEKEALDLPLVCGGLRIKTRIPGTPCICISNFLQSSFPLLMSRPGHAGSKNITWTGKERPSPTSLSGSIAAEGHLSASLPSTPSVEATTCAISQTT